MAAVTALLLVVGACSRYGEKIPGAHVVPPARPTTSIVGIPTPAPGGSATMHGGTDAVSPNGSSDSANSAAVTARTASARAVPHVMPTADLPRAPFEISDKAGGNGQVLMAPPPSRH